MGCAHGSQRNLGQGKKSSLVMALYCPNHSVQITLHSPMITFCTQIICLQSFCKRGRNSDAKLRQQEFTCKYRWRLNTHRASWGVKVCIRKDQV